MGYIYCREMVRKECRLSMNMNSIICPNEYEMSKLGGEVMVTSESMDDVLIVNVLGADILDYINACGSVTVASVIDKIKQEYESDSIEEDVIDFLDEMKDSNVILVS